MFVVFTALVFFAFAQSSGSNMVHPTEMDDENPEFVCRIECSELDI